MIEVWVLMGKAALQVAWDIAHSGASNPDVAILNQGIRGFWKDFQDSGNTYEVVNVVEDDIQPILDFQTAFSSDIFGIYGWTQGNGLDNDGTEGGFITAPQVVLDVMKDHPNGDPPTFENPSWGHVFLGQAERDFSGEFSLQFSKEFF
jgi:hypothetical protein